MSEQIHIDQELPFNSYNCIYLNFLQVFINLLQFIIVQLINQMTSFSLFSFFAYLLNFSGSLQFLLQELSHFFITNAYMLQYIYKFNQELISKYIREIN